MGSAATKARTNKYGIWDDTRRVIREYGLDGYNEVGEIELDTNVMIFFNTGMDIQLVKNKVGRGYYLQVGEKEHRVFDLYVQFRDFYVMIDPASADGQIVSNKVGAAQKIMGKTYIVLNKRYICWKCGEIEFDVVPKGAGAI